MERYCANCKTPIRSHVLVVDGLDFHRKTCYCWHAGHKVEGDKKNKPQPCRVCEPKASTTVKAS